MNIILKYTAIALTVSLWAITPSRGADNQPEWSADAGIGYEYDSNVSIAEIDTNTGESDNALVLEFNLDSIIPLGERWKLDLGYGYADTRYQDFGEFDLALHQLHGELAYRGNGIDAGLGIDHFIARLDNDGFVDITRIAPGIGRLFGQRFYLRGSVARMDKDYADFPARDATSDALRGDLYLLLDGMRRYLAMSLQLDDENAAAAEFDYDGMRARLSYGHTLDVGPRALTLKAFIKLEDRDYATPPGGLLAGGEARRDERWETGLSGVLALTESFDLGSELSYADNRSTLATADFDEAIFNLKLSYRF